MVASSARSTSGLRLGLAIPVAPDEDAGVGIQRDFMRDATPEARRVTRERAARLLRDVTQALDPGCVKVLKTRADLDELFVGLPTVVTLFAHSPSGENVELLEERVSFASLLESVPVDFAGLLDLRVCDAERSWADHVRRVRPRCSVQAPDGKIDFRAAAWTYARTLQLVVSAGKPYDEAARQALADLEALSSKRS